MFRLLIWLLLAYIGFKLLKSLVSPNRQVSLPLPREGEDTVQDPICKVYLDRDDAIVGTLDGQRHYFCSMGCLEKFREQLDHTQHS